MKKTSKDLMTTAFRALVPLTTTTTTGSLNFTPANISTRLTTLADVWELFRIDKMRFRLVPQTTGSTTTGVGVAWIPDIVDTIPATLAAQQAFINSTFGLCPSGGALYQVSKFDWVNIPVQDLRGALPWYKAVEGSPAVWLECPGLFSLVCAGSGAAITIYIEVEGVLTFKGAADPGSTPYERALRQVAAEKKRLLAILASTEDGKTAGGGSSRPK